MEQKAIDDALELLDLLVANELVGTAVRVADKEMLRTHARLTDAAGSSRSAVRVLLDGMNEPERPTLDELWTSISEVVSVGALEQAVAAVEALAPAGEGSRQDWRAMLSARRIVTVSGFLSILTEVIDFDADLESQPVLDAMLSIPDLVGQRRPLTGGDIDESIVPAAWRPAVFGSSGRSDAGIDKNSYVFCVLVEFQRHLKRRGIYAPRSTRWTDPRVSLLDGDQWEASKDVVLTALALPIEPAGLLVENRSALDDAYRRVAAYLDDTGSDLSVDDAGRVHLAALAAVPEPESLVVLRRTVAAMLPRVAGVAAGFLPTRKQDRQDLASCRRPQRSDCLAGADLGALKSLRVFARTDHYFHCLTATATSHRGGDRAAIWST